MIAMDQMLERCRQALGPAPRRFSFWEERSYLLTPRPSWCDSSDGLFQFFEGQKRLLREGVVVWGHIVQANMLMYRKGVHNCPGEVVYCLEKDADDIVPYLKQVAHTLFRLKGTQPEEGELRPFAEYLTNELIRVFGLEVPPSVSAIRNCAVSTVYFNRKHLPNGILSQVHFPILVSPGSPRLAMALPSKYWPQPLIYKWGQQEPK